VKCQQCGKIFDAGLGACPACHRALSSLEIATVNSAASQGHTSNTLIITKKTTQAKLFIAKENGKYVTKCIDCSEKFDLAAGKCPKCGRAIPPGVAEIAMAAMVDVEAQKSQSAGQPLQ
jgi:rRNA maturation endonuclease Nob1